MVAVHGGSTWGQYMVAVHGAVHGGSTRVVSSLLCVLPLLMSSQVTEGVQAGPSVGEMSERSQKLEEEIEAMSSQLHATAAS